MVRLKISQIKSGMENIEVEGEIISITSPRQVYTKYGPAKVATAILRDETGSIRLVLWRGQIDRVRRGDYIRITDAYTREFRGNLELYISRSGKIIVIRRYR